MNKGFFSAALARRFSDDSGLLANKATRSLLQEDARILGKIALYKTHF